MGFSVAWLAVRGLEKGEIFQRFGLYDTGEVEDFPESPVCGAEFPDGAYLLCLRDCFHRFVTPKFLRKASKACSILGCQIEERIMASSSFFYQDGKRQWNIVHESDRGADHLHFEGDLPEAFREIYREAVANQQQEDSRTRGANEEIRIDYIFEVPVRLAATLSGYSHDRVAFSWGQPRYAKLQEGRLN